MVKLVLGFAGSRCSAYSFIDLSYLELLVFCLLYSFLGKWSLYNGKDGY